MSATNGAEREPSRTSGLDLGPGRSAALDADGGSFLRLGAARAFSAGHAAGASDTAGFVALVVR